MATDSPSELAHIPPLPASPEPPRLPPDLRQRGFAGVVGRLADVLGDGIAMQSANLSSGFHASAVDLGRLKTALEHGVQRLDMVAVRDRWEVDVAACRDMPSCAQNTWPTST